MVQDNNNPQLPDESVAVETEQPTAINRTHRPSELNENDPLDLAAAAEPEATEAEVPEQPSEEAEKTESNQVEEEEEVAETEGEQQPPVQLSEEESKLADGLDKVIQAKTGVGFDDLVSVLTELLTWRNDILQAEQLQSQQEQNAPNINPTAPQFRRAQGRQPLPATNSYDYRRSEILAMSPAEYEKNAQKITAAYMNGRVLNDT